MGKNCRLALCFSVLFSMNILAFAEEAEQEIETNELKYLWSLDTDLTLTALKNFGYGIGVNYERKLTEFLSIKPGFGHMVCFSEIMAVTVNLQLFLNYYPLSNGLDKLYFGLGNGSDFIMYPNEDDMSEDNAISITPVLGWKWNIFKHLMIEPFLGWKFYIRVTNNNKNIENYLNNGFQWGINFKLIFIK
jgi:hypothetical protein